MTQFSGWNNAVVLIIGASRGIGRAMAKAAAIRGAKVGLIARSQENLDAVLNEIDHKGICKVADVSVYGEITHAINFINKQLGPIDVLINCAGIGDFGAFNETDIHLFEKLMRVNYLGTVYSMKAVMPSMLARKKGCIVNVASVAGRIGAPFEAAYSASKFAVIGLSEAIQREVESQGVHVSIVNPGPVDTDFFETRGTPYPFKSPKIISPSEVVNAIIEAIERNKEETFVPAWLRTAYRAKTIAPSLYSIGINRMYHNQLKINK